VSLNSVNLERRASIRPFLLSLTIYHMYIFVFGYNMDPIESCGELIRVRIQYGSSMLSKTNFSYDIFDHQNFA